jgi:glutaconate CoA-transferase subunit A
MTLADFTPPQRRSKEVSLEEAGKLIAQRKVVSLAGSQTINTPMALIREALRQGARDLTIIPPVSSGIGPDLMIAAGRVATFYVCYIGFELLGFAPAFRKAAESKSIKVIEADEAFIMLGTRAAAGGMPFVPIEGVYEATDLPRLNPILKRVTDPFTGKEIMAIPPLRSEVCIIHAQARRWRRISSSSPPSASFRSTGPARTRARSPCPATWWTPSYTCRSAHTRPPRRAITIPTTIT